MIFLSSWYPSMVGKDTRHRQALDGAAGGKSGRGMYSGEGKPGDDGVPSEGGMLGIVSVPAFLKGFVELALILGEADFSFSGFGEKAAAETIEPLPAIRLAAPCPIRLAASTRIR